MSTETECPTIRNCRRAATLAAVLAAGADALSEAHAEFGDHPNVKPAVEAILKRGVGRLVAAAKRSPEFRPSEQFHVEVSEFHSAIPQAMAVLFPPAEEE